MKRLCMYLAALVLGVPVLAQSTEIVTGHWSVSSSEELSERPNLVVSYPLTNLFDNNKKTAWVFRGKKVETEPGRWSDQPSRYSIRIDFGRDRIVDGLRIMNGYNKDLKTFRKNNRVTEIVVDGDLRGKGQRLSLPDAMGWHTVHIKPVTATYLSVYLTRFAKPTDVDICLSGIEVLSKGKPIPFPIPRYVLFSAGAGCC
jgi:hypothetical protein